MSDEKVSSEELRDEMLSVFRNIAHYWASLPDYDPATGRSRSVADRCDGVVFSILSQLDGVGSLPAFDLVAHVHPDDDDQSLEGVTISYNLHEHYYRTPTPEKHHDQ